MTVLQASVTLLGSRGANYCDMTNVRWLIAVFVLVLAAFPPPARATILNGMKVIWQVDEVALNNVASAAGFTTSSETNSARSSLELAPDVLAPADTLVTDCQTRLGTVGTIAVACLRYVPGLYKLACVVGGVVSVRAQ
jgi:hypothetical protein